jgi:hypothetical protein
MGRIREFFKGKGRAGEHPIKNFTRPEDTPSGLVPDDVRLAAQNSPEARTPWREYDDWFVDTKPPDPKSLITTPVRVSKGRTKEGDPIQVGYGGTVKNQLSPGHNHWLDSMLQRGNFDPEVRRRKEAEEQLDDWLGY